VPLPLWGWERCGTGLQPVFCGAGFSNLRALSQEHHATIYRDRLPYGRGSDQTRVPLPLWGWGTDDALDDSMI